jgi:hypothetical protein
MPKKNTNPAMWDLVLEQIKIDAKARDEFGLNKYGTRLQPFNGRDSLTDAFQEQLDGLVYLYQAMYENKYTRPVVLAAIEWVDKYYPMIANPSEEDDALFYAVNKLKAVMGN